jgi:hypothetical protein
MKKNKQERYSSTTEDNILLDTECSARYENIHPGTVTVEGFRMECWEYEEKFGKPRQNTMLVDYSDMPKPPAKKLLRRLDSASSRGWKVWMESHPRRSRP